MFKFNISLYLFVLICLLYQTTAGQINPEKTYFFESHFMQTMHINCILKDSNGFLWFGTEQGLLRFDGHEFSGYTPEQNRQQGTGSNNIKSIVEDEDGNIWIGAMGSGLTKFDTNLCTFFYYTRQNDSLRISSNNINDLAVDTTGNIWIGYSDKGLDLLQPETGQIDNYRYKKDDRHGIISSGISALHVDNDNNLWIGTWDEGLCFLDSEQVNQAEIKTSFEFKDISFVNDSARIHKIFDIETDENGIVWIAAFGEGIFAYNTKNRRFINLTEYVSLSEMNRKRELRSLFQTEQGEIIFGCDNSFFIVDKTKLFRINAFLKGQKETILADSLNFTAHTLSSNIIKAGVYSIYEDHKENVWVGTNVGVYKFRKKIFPVFRINPALPDRNNTVSFTVNHTGDVFASVWEEGIYRATMNSTGIYGAEFRKIPVHPDFTDEVTCLLSDSIGNLWISTMNRGFFKYDMIMRKTFSKELNIETNHVDNIDYVIVSCFGPENSVFFGTGAGLVAYLPDKDKLFYYCYDEHNPHSLSHNYITSLLFENDTVLWAGTLQDGLNRGVINTSVTPWEIKFNTFLYDFNNDSSISGNSITCLYQTENNQIWVGTRNNGLNLYNSGTGSFKRYGIKEGIGSNHIGAILEDSHNNLWIATDEGITRFNSYTGDNFSYPVYPGKHIHFFTQNASVKTPGGSLIFGTKDGFVAFDPDNIDIPAQKSPLRFTGFRIKNKLLSVGEKVNNKVVLKQSLNKTKKITLDYNNNSFSIFFSLLDFSSQSGARYKYKLEGFDQEWAEPGSGKGIVDYTNIPAGYYTFRVQGFNTDNYQDHSSASLDIRILPPWYKTTYAYALFVLIVIIFSYIIRKITILRFHYINEIDLQKKLREKDSEVMETKMRFFTNISHEIRTPITLITAPLKMLFEKEFNDPKLKNQIGTILRNALKMNSLVEQLVDFRKIESRQESLKVYKYELKSFLEDIIDDFKSISQQNNIQLLFSTNQEELFVWFDRDKMSKIVRNILSNACKFTPDGGRITIKLFMSGQHKALHPELVDTFNTIKEVIVIEFTDTGTGIPAEHINKIFDRFYKIDPGNNQMQVKGTGIGLSITKEYVKMHRGHIMVRSTPGIETTFTIILLPGNDHFDASDIIDKPVLAHSDSYTELLYEQTLRSEKKSVQLLTEQNDDQEKPVILLAEDNRELLSFLTEFFSESFRVIQATNGYQAYQSVSKHPPDIIVSDIMMPQMDGLELTQKIKKDIRTCHIPVILLTAKGSIENRIEGLKTGADSYIPKPFHPVHLEVRVKKLLELRSRLKEKFSFDFTHDISDDNMGSLDREFLHDLTAYVEKNLGNPDLNVEKLGQDLGMSRSNLFKKLKSLLGLTPSEFTRTIRLKKAAKLLLEDAGAHISDVCFRVGFNSPAYFTHCFKKQFGKTPKEFIEEQKNKDSYSEKT